MTTAQQITCAKCKRRVESLEMAMMNLTKFKRSVAVLQSGGGGSKGNDISDLIVDLYLLPKSVPLVASNFSICTEPKYIHIH